MNLRLLEEDVSYNDRLQRSLDGMDLELGFGARKKMRERIRQLWTSYVRKYEDVPVTDEILEEIAIELTKVLGKYKGIVAQVKVARENSKFIIEPLNYETWEFIDEIYKETKNES